MMGVGRRKTFDMNSFSLEQRQAIAEGMRAGDAKSQTLDGSKHNRTLIFPAGSLTVYLQSLIAVGLGI
ncbi:hypothetical protein CA85_20740 [Allorhodopirellula solitaria]|uniref:Uncharacterized protein n=2 Tax=Allorhodopirellula solitaria TaxID=2527987 RepID=A0A5C5XZ58_9BACT|nr:hypothetical protein CA85_20740 [Allorhodopirellula solitaria]